MRPIIDYIKHPASLCDSLVRHFCQWLPDSLYLKLRYRFQMGKRLNLRCPCTFQEKLQWLKIHDHNPLYTTMVDKILVKDYVSSKIGSHYIIPLLGIWDRPEDIEWEKLPSRFVLKTNHSGGNTGVVICKNKTTFDYDNAIKKLNASLKADVYRDLREWPYKNVSKKIFAEEYIEITPTETSLTDYKWYCFNGEPKFCQVIQDRSTNETIDFFDTEWQHLDFVGLNPLANNSSVPHKCPENLKKQIEIARKLSAGIPFSRIDLYESGIGTLFGEITFYPASGIGSFRPDKYDRLLGEMLDISELM